MISIIWWKCVFHQLNVKITTINDKVNVLKLFFLKYEKQNSKYQYTLQICLPNEILVDYECFM